MNLQKRLQNKLDWLKSTKGIKTADAKLTVDELETIVGLMGTAPASGEVGTEPVAWITREQLEAVRDESSDAWVYWREQRHVAEPDEVPLYAAPIAADQNGEQK